MYPGNLLGRTDTLVWEDETPSRHKNLPRMKEAIRRADLHLYGSKLSGPGLSVGHRNPYPTKAKKEKQTSLIREVIY